MRISQKVDTPLTANVLVLESRKGDRSLDAAVMISCDLVVISPEMSQAVLEATRRRLPGFDLKKMFLNATHTHTGPTTSHGVYDIPKTGVMQVDAYCRFAAERIAEAVEKAWTGRKPGSITWGLGHAVVAQNRRAVYADGHAEMYGQTTSQAFAASKAARNTTSERCSSGTEEANSSAIVVNVSCPAQEAEGLRNINADFWHPVRESLRARYGAGVCVLGWCGAAGDESPHLMYRKAAEERIAGRLRKLTRLEELCAADRGRGRRGLRSGQGRPAPQCPPDSQGGNAAAADASGDGGGMRRGPQGDRDGESNAYEEMLGRKCGRAVRETEDRPSPCSA